MLTCGFIGAPLALDAVAETGDVALLYDLLLRSAYPSWGYMAAQGATTMWERWNSDAGDIAMNSFNHYAFGAVAGFFYRRIAGIDTKIPGFASLSMRPLFEPRIGHARATYQSIRGPIEAGWRYEDDAMIYEVSVPANVDAELWLPAAGELKRNQISSGRHRFSVPWR
jgi:alpha-L-rhamnosidase